MLPRGSGALQVSMFSCSGVGQHAAARLQEFRHGWTLRGIPVQERQHRFLKVSQLVQKRSRGRWGLPGRLLRAQYHGNRLQ